MWADSIDLDGLIEQFTCSGQTGRVCQDAAWKGWETRVSSVHLPFVPRPLWASWRRNPWLCSLVLQEELASIDSELQAVEVQVQELLEHQQALIQKKTVLKRKIEQLSDSGSGGSQDAELTAEAWNKKGLLNQLLLLLHDPPAFT